MQKTILVAGAAGFLGSHLSIKLCMAGYRVIGLDNLSTGNLKNLELLKSNPLFAFIEGDILGALDLPVDIILNFACPASPPRYQADPVETFKTSVFGTYNLLELARKYKAIFLQASTSEIYGCPTEHPQKESYWGNVNTIGVRSCYDEGKRAAETLCHDYRLQKKVATKIIRIFNTYGPHMDQDDGRVVSNFIVQALQGNPLEIYGDGSTTRSFCYVDDLIEGIYRFLFVIPDYPGPINLGNPEEQTIQSIAEKILFLTQSKSLILYKNRLSDDPEKRCPDIALAKDILQWAPQVSSEEGFLRTIAYFENKLFFEKDFFKQKERR